MFDVVSILERLNYPITTRGKNCVCPTSYRGGDNKNGLYVNESGLCYDQVLDRKFPLVDFVSEVLNCSPKDARAFLSCAEYVEAPRQEKIEIPEFNLRDIQNLTPSFKFYHDRGISSETLNTFKAGLSHGGKYNLRICFPVFEKDKIIGVAARDVMNRENAPKWKLSKKENFVYPLFVSEPHIIQKKKVILVESVGDMLNLWEHGVRNILVIFGLHLNKRMQLALMRLNPGKILIALNNDEGKEHNSGQEAAAKLKRKLSEFFKAENLIDAPPLRNDFGDMSGEEIKEWAMKYEEKN